MKRLQLIVILVILVVPVPAGATVDAGGGVCVQTDGQVGLWNGSTADDAGCVTLAEYTATFGVEVLDDQLVVGPDPEPDAPTVREYWDATTKDHLKGTS